jgi:hypothetical protein
MLLTPRPTTVYGCNFRSQLEARWAVFFTYAGIPWQYEPRLLPLPDGRNYLPDFLLWDSVWCEVKPYMKPSDKAEALALANPQQPVVLLDGQPEYSMYMRLGLQPCWTGIAPSLGCFVDAEPADQTLIWNRPIWYGVADEVGQRNSRQCPLYIKARGCAHIADFRRGKAYIRQSYLDGFQ